MKCVIVSCQDFLVNDTPPPDDVWLQRALQERTGEGVDVIAWENTRYAWEQADLVVIRSAWNWYQAHERYLNWCERIAKQTLLLNPLTAIKWSCNKFQYFADLQRAGVPTIPTTLLPY